MIDEATAAVRHQIEVDTPPERAFDLFTRMSSWWPPEHRLMEEGLREVVIEPHVGGRCYQVGASGEQCDWAKVLVWEPPHRLVLAWHLTSQFEFDADSGRASEVEVAFADLGDRRSRVTLEHRHIERHGPGSDELRVSVDGPNGWPHILGRFGEAVAVW
jgi:uncharacterized protein YndB with AHSA1/START domain